MARLNIAKSRIRLSICSPKYAHGFDHICIFAILHGNLLVTESAIMRIAGTPCEITSAFKQLATQGA
jgi:hypothetical protein